MKHLIAILSIFICLSSFGQNAHVDTLKFEQGFCYHDALSCHTMFQSADGEVIEFVNADLGEFEHSDWEKAGVKDEYKDSWFIITYQVVRISEEESLSGDAYNAYQIMEIKLK